MIVEVDGRQAHAATGGIDITATGGIDVTATGGIDITATGGIDITATGKPVVLLLHGAGMDSTVWQQQTRFLAHRNLRAVAVDLPGHGGSEGAPIESIAEMAHWVSRFMDAADLSPALVAGHSMGSFIALELARHHPHHVGSLVLMGTAVGMPVHPELISASENQLDKAAALMASWGHAKPAHIGLNPTPGLWMLGGARALVENSDPGVLTVDFNACASYTDAAEAARTVTCPVHVVIGLGDKMTPPKAAAKLTAEMNQDHLTVTELSDVGHMMMIEDPRSTRQVLLDAATAAGR